MYKCKFNVNHRACLRDHPSQRLMIKCYCAQKSYTLFFSGARIDHGHHKGQAVRAVTDAVALAKAVSGAVDMVDKGDHVTYMLLIIVLMTGSDETVDNTLP